MKDKRRCGKASTMKKLDGGGMKHIRTMYNVPARRGMRIRFLKHEMGTIVGAKHGRLRVRFDGLKRIATMHPTWAMEYFPDSTQLL